MSFARLAFLLAASLTVSMPRAARGEAAGWPRSAGLFQGLKLQNLYTQHKFSDGQRPAGC